ncbi:actin-domain-containing protein [Myxozyma melibiosi]|uniref:Actin-domain-containing protein n=1 Tax=Myxozyma melibiosi TaxID=54550 RepID=A0ABR1F200_9ASCO
MPPFRDESIFVIATGSQTTKVQYGLPESLTPAQKVVSTRVYRTAQSGFSMEGAESDAVYPIKDGIIEDLEALQYLIGYLYRTTINLAPDATPFSPILMTSNSEWRPKQIESIISYVFNTLHVPAVTVIPESLAAVFSYASPTACVVNIGYEKTEITPVVDFCISDTAQEVFHGVGGKLINEELEALLPNLKPYQIEELKRSKIYEILSEISMGFFGEPSQPATTSLEDEGIVDVAAIVTSDNARELLAQREQQLQNGKQVELKNSEMPRNSFVDSTGNRIEVGTERFKGAEKLVEQLAQAIGRTIAKMDDITKRGDCWDNIVLVGGPTVIRGFVDAVLLSLQEHFLVNRTNTFSEIPSGINTPGGYGSPIGSAYGQMHTMGHGQVPTSIKIARLADYFLGWKGHTWENAQFLGCQIAAKQIFTPGIASIDGAYISKEDFAEYGAKQIWSLGLF